MCARGAKEQQQLLNQQAGTQFQNSQNLYGSINAADQGILANPGFSKEQVNTQMNADADHRRDSDDTVLIQLGDAFVEAGLPRPMKADTDRVGGWMLMYQLLESGYWSMDPSCKMLIECLPSLSRGEDGKRGRHCKD